MKVTENVVSPIGIGNLWMHDEDVGTWCARSFARMIWKSRLQPYASNGRPELLSTMTFATRADPAVIDNVGMTMRTGRRGRRYGGVVVDGAVWLDPGVAVADGSEVELPRLEHPARSTKTATMTNRPTGA